LHTVTIRTMYLKTSTINQRVRRETEVRGPGDQSQLPPSMLIGRRNGRHIYCWNAGTGIKPLKFCRKVSRVLRSVTGIHDKTGRLTCRRQPNWAVQGASRSTYCGNVKNLEPVEESGFMKIRTSYYCKLVRTQLVGPKARQSSLCST